jgi:hypothetical protein
MKIFHDWEFIDNGETIMPISVGMIADDGRTLYYINSDEGVIEEALRHDWLRENVMVKLPILIGPYDPLVAGYHWTWDPNNPDYAGVASIDKIRSEVLVFIQATPGPELWAWYGAYDHVVLAQLFGPMTKLPAAVPMWTNDLKQEAHRLGNPRMPAMQSASTEHHALHDAVADMRRYEWLRSHAADLDQKRIKGILDRSMGLG